MESCNFAGVSTPRLDEEVTGGTPTMGGVDKLESNRTTARRRAKTPRYEFDFLDNETQRELQQVCSCVLKICYVPHVLVLCTC
jgi:hypothetical protein